VQVVAARLDGPAPADEAEPMIDAVVYDFGGVFMASPFEAIRQMSEDKGAEFEETLAIVFGPYAEDTDHPWHRVERGELALDAARDEIQALGREQGHDIDLYDMLQYIGSSGGVVDAMVDNVRRVRAAGLKTAVLTNNLAEGRDFWRPLIPLDELFDAVVDSSEVGMRKPNPEIYRYTLAQLGGVAPERTAFLDDFDGNVVAAKALGMIGILVEVDPSGAIAEVDALLAQLD
jgi:epoxide hydrolase-like predicted phosphatase